MSDISSSSEVRRAQADPGQPSDVIASLIERQQNYAARQLAADRSKSRDRMNAYRILHVEDEPDIRDVVEMSLALDPGITLKSCVNGPDALAAAANWGPDVILMDVMMPFMDGPETLAHLRESARTAHIPVVFMTARAQTHEVEHFLSLGAVGVIPKPFDPMTLAAAVRGYLR